MSADPLRVAIYGAGAFAHRAHLPNLAQLPEARMVAVCDANLTAAEKAATQYGIPAVYGDGMAMLEAERIDVLFSVVPPFARGPLEIAAVRRGIHLFCEKPQAMTIRGAQAIDAAIRDTGVVATVGFRERYRPIWQAARAALAGKRIAHVSFVISEDEVGSAGGRSAWYAQFSRSGGRGLDWGVHALDLTRFISGADIARAQSFFLQEGDDVPWSWQFNFQLTGGATLHMSMISRSAGGGDFAAQQPWFTFYAEGGCMRVFGYDRIEWNGETVFRGEPYDPWLAQVRCFLQAVRNGDRSLLLSDYSDGLQTLAPVLAAWDSARSGGNAVDVQALLAHA
jgi:predicted dehydrogenase